MIIHVPPKARKYHSQLVTGFYAARKRIFKDRMQWDVSADNSIEMDSTLTPIVKTGTVKLLSLCVQKMLISLL